MSRRRSLTSLKRELAVARELSQHPADAISYKFAAVLHKLSLVDAMVSYRLSLEIKYRYAKRYKLLQALVKKAR
jgi:hypothetical protein